MRKPWQISFSLLLLPPLALAQHPHDHPAPEKLGKVDFPTSCAPAVQNQFNRAVALLHSFAYTEAATLMRAAADEEDAIEKLPVTPGPILPAREQLGSLLLEQRQPNQALKEFEAALANAPGRRGAMNGIAQAQLACRK